MKTATIRTLILPFFLLVCYQHSFSQVTAYTPFPEKYGKWIIHKTGPTGPDVNGPALWHLTQYEIAGDTVIGGFTYQKIKASNELQNINPNPKDYWTYDFGVKQLSFAYRNDVPNKKVYILMDINQVINGKLTTEYLWYDFNIGIGDTLKNMYAVDAMNPMKYYHTIKKTDSVLRCGNYSKRFHFSCTLGFGDELIEGLGFLDHFIRTQSYCYFEPAYQYKTYFKCSPLTIPDDLQTASVVVAFPNPTSHTLQLSWAGQTGNTLLNYSIVDCFGTIMIQKNRMDELIDVSAFPNGMYFIMLRDEQGKIYKSKFIKQE